MVIGILLIIVCILLVSLLYRYWKLLLTREILENEKEKFKCQSDLLCQWIRNINKGITVDEILTSYGANSIAIYGKGNLGRLLYKNLEGSNIKVKFFIDKNAGRIIEDLADTIGTISDEDLSDLDAIIVTLPYDYLKIKEFLEKETKNNIRIISIEEIVYRL